MSARVYIRPTGLVPWTPEARLAWRENAPLPLCGEGPFAFTALEAIRRDGARVERRCHSLSDIWDANPGPEWSHASEDFERLTAPRRRLEGLPMDRPRIMGVVNVTPDSFSDGGRLPSAQAAIAHALQLAADGAAILDIGGESTRPGSDATPLAEELDRVLPVIEGLRGKTEALISIDTRKAEVARRALAAGAHIVNDVTALSFDPDMAAIVAEASCPVILMHALGDPKTMQDDPRYIDAPTEIYDYLEARIEAATAAGVKRDKIVVDPGIGFGKTLEHNLQIMGALTLYHGLGRPVLVGASRKRFIGRLTNEPEPIKRVAGSVGAALAGAAQGAQILRVHDVRETKAALEVFMASLHGGSPDQPSSA